MRAVWVTAAAIALLALAVFGIVRINSTPMAELAPAISVPRGTTLQLTSTAFSEGGAIPSKYTCDGAGISPPLAVAGVPESAVSLVLLMDDPDAPSGTWDHWVVFNIPPDTRSIEEGAEPAGTHGRGSGAALMYAGPCPPDREHRYFFKLYALDTALDLPEGASKEDVEQAMEGHVLGVAQLMGRYHRTQ